MFSRASATAGGTLGLPDRPDFERPASREVFFARSGPLIKTRILDGDIVTLKLGEVSVIVHSIVSTSAGRYRGTIAGFEKGLGLTCEGYSVGEAVEFTERQMFGCAGP